MMLPKDLLDDLEKGDRTMEMLKVNEEVGYARSIDELPNLNEINNMLTNTTMNITGFFANHQAISAQQMLSQQQNMGGIRTMTWGGV